VNKPKWWEVARAGSFFLIWVMTWHMLSHEGTPAALVDIIGRLLISGIQAAILVILCQEWGSK